MSRRERDDPPASGGAIDGVLLNTLGKALLPLNIALTSETLGRGTFSIVYRAIISGDGAAAVKCIHGLYPGNVYRREAMLAAEAASSGGGLPLLTVAALSTAPIMVTPHVHARSFAALVRSASLEEVRRYMRSLLLDLSVVHACGIVHRDVKPKNFVYDCRAGVGWLTDFGLADTVEALSRKLQKKLAAARTLQEKALAAREAGGGGGGAGKPSGVGGGGSRARTNTGGTGMHQNQQQQHHQQSQQQQQRRVTGLPNTAAVQSRGGSERGGGGGLRRQFGGGGDTGMLEEGGAFDESAATNAPKGKAMEVSPPSPVLNPNPSPSVPSLASVVAVAASVGGGGGGGGGTLSAPPPFSHPPSSRDRERQEAEEYMKVSSDARKESRAGNLLRFLPGGVEGGAREILKGRRGVSTHASPPMGMQCEMEESDGGEEEKAEMAQLQARLQRLNVALRDCFVGLPVTTLESNAGGGVGGANGPASGGEREGRGEGGEEDMGGSGSGEPRVEDRTSSARVGDEGALESLSDHLLGGGEGSAISSSSLPAAAASMLGGSGGGGGGGGRGGNGSGSGSGVRGKSTVEGESGEALPKDFVTVKSSHSGGSGSGGSGSGSGSGSGRAGGGGLGGRAGGGNGERGSSSAPPSPPLPLDAKLLDTPYPPHPWGLLPPSIKAPPPPKHRSDPLLEGGLAEQHADRAGTPGFRAPEVLLSSLQQGPALDVWGAGVILLSLLCRRYPLLPGRSDEEQLITLTQLMRDSLRYSSALSLGKELVEIPFSGVGVAHTNTTAGGLASLIGASRLSEPGFDAAFNLILACLDPDPLRRITASGALQHPFFTGADLGGRGGSYVPVPSTIPWPVVPSATTVPPTSANAAAATAGLEKREGTDAAVKARLKATMRAFKERIAGLSGNGELGGSGAVAAAAAAAKGEGGASTTAAAAVASSAATATETTTTGVVVAGASGGAGVGEEEGEGAGGGGNANLGGSEPEEDSELESEGEKGRMGNSIGSQLPSGDDGDDGDGSG